MRDFWASKHWSVTDQLFRRKVDTSCKHHGEWTTCWLLLARQLCKGNLCWKLDPNQHNLSETKERSWDHSTWFRQSLQADHRSCHFYDRLISGMTKSQDLYQAQIRKAAFMDTKLDQALYLNHFWGFFLFFAY